MNPTMEGTGEVQLGISTARSGGVHGQPNVSTGNYARFLDYTAKLNWFLLAAMIPALAIIATTLSLASTGFPIRPRVRT